MSEKVTCYSEFQNAPKAVGPYSPAAHAGGFVFLSGQIALDPVSGQMIGGDVTAQTRQVLANLQAVLKGLGLTFSDVVKTTIFLTNLEDFQTVNSLYAEALEGHQPARSTIQVSRLPRDAVVEIEMIAVKSRA